MGNPSESGKIICHMGLHSKGELVLP